MDSKEGIAQVKPVDAQAAGLLDPLFLGQERMMPQRLTHPESEWVAQPDHQPHQVKTLDGNHVVCISEC